MHNALTMSTRATRSCVTLLELQLQSWKERACQATGSSASIGIAFGGAAATAVVAVASLTQGLVQGAASAIAGQEGMSLPAVRSPGQFSVGSVELKRWEI